MILGRIEKIVLFLIFFVLYGCIFPCKTRIFRTDDKWLPITDEWKVAFWMRCKDNCNNTRISSDIFSFWTVITIEQKYLDDDSLKNASYHIDSLYLEFAGSTFKRINEKKEFVYAKKPIGRDPKVYYDDWFSISRTDSLRYIKWPSVPKDVKTVTTTLFISFKNPDDGQIESKKITKKLYERFDLDFVTYEEWK